MVIYHVAPSSFWGRVFASFMVIVVLLAALFVSFLVFWVILTFVLFLIVYLWLTSRGVRQQEGKIINIQKEDQKSEASQSNRTSRH